jgi:hypothetical protein
MTASTAKMSAISLSGVDAAIPESRHDLVNGDISVSVILPEGLTAMVVILCQSVMTPGTDCDAGDDL